MKTIQSAAGHRLKWLVLVGWLAVIALLVAPALRYSDAQNNRDANFLPKSAQSLKAIQLEGRGFGDELLPGLLVYRNGDGLTAADKTAIAADVSHLRANPLEGQVGSPELRYFDDGKTGALYMQLSIHGNEQVLFRGADRLRALSADYPNGLSAKLTGPMGYFDDSVRVFDTIDRSMLLGTMAIVTLLLLLIYRSPFLWLLPLVSVGFAEIALRGAGTLLTDAGMTITTQAAALTTVLVFGVGTDYALLLIARYREELRRNTDIYVAMAQALRSSGPSIVASAATVAAALLCLLLADVNATSGAGPIGAMGIFITMLAMLTVLPALLLLGGRRVFWPHIPRFHENVQVHGGAWPKLARRIAARPRMVCLGVFAVMALMATGLTTNGGGLDLSQSFRGDVDSVVGQKMLAEALPPGASGPMAVLINDSRRAPRVVAALKNSPHIASVGAAQAGSHGVVRVESTLRYSPYSEMAIDAIEPIRADLERAAPGAALVAGPTAVEADSRHFAARDNKVIMPIALLVVTLILILLLRAIVAPLVLVLTVVASYVAVMGFSYVAFHELFGFPGVDEYLALFVFIFLVALGVDYNIFLMARVREEVTRRGAREGMRRGLILSGGVITSAGVVLAGTFMVMAAMPMTMLTEIGFAIAIGVLFDALVVRTALVPALGFILGRAMWWPSSLSKRDSFSGGVRSVPTIRELPRDVASGREEIDGAAAEVVNINDANAGRSTAGEPAKARRIGAELPPLPRWTRLT